MKQFWAFVLKEFYHIFRDKQTMLILLLMPVVQVFLFGYAITTDIKNSAIVILDSAQDEHSRRLIADLNASAYFHVESILQSSSQIDATFRKGKIKIAILIPEDFGSRLDEGKKAPVQLIVDASNPNEANIITNYVYNIVGNYQQELLKNMPIAGVISTDVHMLYNPQLKSAYTFVPGVIGLVLMLICTLMTSVSIVREKELGTMEVLLVSPSKPIYIIFSKTIPYFVISMCNVITIVLLSVFAFDVPIRGSIALLIGSSITYIFTSLALGLLISTISKTQQIAMIISLVGLMLPTVLLSGLMFPIESMPGILQWISNIVPATWFIQMVKTIMIKGLGFAYIWKEWCILLGMTILFIAISVKRFKVRL
ncbi:MAG: ABC transporter permease [Bacteroidales bacterium]